MCNNNGKKEKGEKAKQVTKKVENENFLNMLVCSLALPLTPFPFGLPLSLSFSPFLFQNFLSLVLGNCSKTNCKLRTNWLTEPKAAIKSVG